MNKTKALICLLVGLSATSATQPTDDEDIKVSIATYQGGKEAAISYTFDDGLLDQYTLAYPELEKRNIKATFGIIGNAMGTTTQKRTCMTWEQAAEMAQSGHEITNHGWNHQNLTKLTGEALRYEIQHNDTAIFIHTGVFPRTYIYPGNRKSEEAVAQASAGRVGTRMRQVDIGSRRDAQWLTQWVDTLIANRSWGIGMTHGIAQGYDHFADPQVFWNHLDEVNRRRNQLWIATLHDVSAYLIERDHTKLDIERSPGKLLVHIHSSLDKDLYNVPLTLLLTCVPDPQVVTATQQGKSLTVTLRKDGVAIDILPHGGLVEILTALPTFPPDYVTSDMDFKQMLSQLGIRLPVLPSLEADPNRPAGIVPIASKPGRWRTPGGDERKRSPWGLWTNYDDRSAGLFPGPDSLRVESYTPLPLLITPSGRPVETKTAWYKEARPALLHAVREERIGFLPDKEVWPDISFEAETSHGTSRQGDYIQQVLTGEIDCSSYPSLKAMPQISCLIRLPRKSSKPVPIMIVICHPEQIEKYWDIMGAQGWGVCLFNPFSIQPDNGEGLTTHLIGLLNKGNWRKPTDIGAIGAWIWGVSRVVDWLITQKSINPKAIGVSGHSRFGKTAFYAMAFDDRIAIAFPSDAGCLGTGMVRRHWGEDVELAGYHWMTGNILRYCGPLKEGHYLPRKVENMTTDAHSVLALCAPRPVFVNSGIASQWADPYGMFLTLKEASPVYELLTGKGFIITDEKPVVDKAYIEGNIGYRLHKEGHTDTPDWPTFFEFAKKHIF